MPAARPEVLIETVRLAGVVPLFGATESQLPPFVVEAAAVKLSAPPLLATERVWGAALPFTCALKPSADGLVVSTGTLLTVSVTATVVEPLADAGLVTVTVPL